MSDIVERLRERHATWLTVVPLMTEAAAEIERLQATIKQFRERLSDMEDERDRFAAETKRLEKLGWPQEIGR
jgi:predicted nuclease with TOPRIM domain